MIKRQLYSEPFALGEAASFIFWAMIVRTSLSVFCTQLQTQILSFVGGGGDGTHIP